MGYKRHMSNVSATGTEEDMSNTGANTEQSVSDGAIVGIVLGSLALLILIILGILKWRATVTNCQGNIGYYITNAKLKMGIPCRKTW